MSDVPDLPQLNFYLSCQRLFEDAAQLEEQKQFHQLLARLDQLVDALESQQDRSSVPLTWVLLSHAFRAATHAKIMEQGSINTSSTDITDIYKYSARDDLLSALAITPDVFIQDDEAIIDNVVAGYERIAESARSISTPRMETDIYAREEGLMLSAQAYANAIFLMREVLNGKEMPDRSNQYRLYYALISHADVMVEAAETIRDTEPLRAAALYVHAAEDIDQGLGVVINEPDMFAKASFRSERASEDPRGRMIAEMLMMIAHRSITAAEILQRNSIYEEDNPINDWKYWYHFARTKLKYILGDMRFVKVLNDTERCQMEYMMAGINCALGLTDDVLEYCEATIQRAHLAIYNAVNKAEDVLDMTTSKMISDVTHLSNSAREIKLTLTGSSNTRYLSGEES